MLGSPLSLVYLRYMRFTEDVIRLCYTYKTVLGGSVALEEHTRLSCYLVGLELTK